MGTRGVRTAVVLALVVTTTVVAGVGTGAPGDRARQTAPTETLGATQVNPDTVLLGADLRGSGDAVWTIEYLVRLETQNDTDAFERLAADVRANRSRYTGRFADRIGRTVASAENTTGREMTVRNVSVRTGRQDLGREYGVVTYTVRWTGFATTNDTAIAAGDALAGFFIDEGTRLTMTWPDGYGVATVSPGPAEQSDRAVAWDGPRDFGRACPTLVVRQGGGGSPGTSGDSDTVLVAALVGLGLLVALAVLAYRRGLLRGGDGAANTAGTAGAADEDGGESGDAGDGPPEELLSNEERVLRLLEDEGGRIKQQAVAQRLDWTDAKTSQVVSSLAEDGEIEKFRIGRENVLALPEESDL